VRGGEKRVAPREPTLSETRLPQELPLSKSKPPPLSSNSNASKTKEERRWV
jgi:hypothetical protein